MATHKSAIKQTRQDVKRRGSNRLHTTRVRTAIKNCRKAIAEGDAEKAQGLLTGTLALLDRTSRAGAMHDNTAARTKSRLQRAVNKAVAG
jgi:small subunit ribosomal protein S20